MRKLNLKEGNMPWITQLLSGRVEVWTEVYLIPELKDLKAIVSCLIQHSMQSPAWTEANHSVCHKGDRSHVFGKQSMRVPRTKSYICHLLAFCHHHLRHHHCSLGHISFIFTVKMLTWLYLWYFQILKCNQWFFTASLLEEYRKAKLDFEVWMMYFDLYSFLTLSFIQLYFSSPLSCDT